MFERVWGEWFGGEGLGRILYKGGAAAGVAVGDEMG